MYVSTKLHRDALFADLGLFPDLDLSSSFFVIRAGVWWKNAVLMTVAMSFNVEPIGLTRITLCCGLRFHASALQRSPVFLRPSPARVSKISSRYLLLDPHDTIQRSVLPVWNCKVHTDTYVPSFEDRPAIVSASDRPSGMNSSAGWPSTDPYGPSAECPASWTQTGKPVPPTFVG